MNTIQFHYPNISNIQLQQFAALYELYKDWNTKINVISRKDIENLYVHHVLHSLSIDKMIKFAPQTSVMDVGTGGGFPGIPLAILFPEVSFHLIDSIAKKIKVVQAIANEIKLSNVTTRHCRVEEEKQHFDFIVSRAVMPLGNLIKLVKKNILQTQQNAIPNGLICLKGGELQSEVAPFAKQIQTIDLADYYQEPFFQTKKIIYMPL